MSFTPGGYDTLGSLLGIRPKKRSVFVSYHHGGDRAFYNAFAHLFAETWNIVQDNSVERLIDSDDADYVIRRIRENYITGSSCTVVLCGAHTPWRKFVDWEIEATLDREHGLVGVNLPTNSPQPNGTCIVPDRLHDNVASGYALWTQWEDLIREPARLSQFIEMASTKSKALVRNGRELRRRNG